MSLSFEAQNPQEKLSRHEGKPRISDLQDTFGCGSNRTGIGTHWIDWYFISGNLDTPSAPDSCNILYLFCMQSLFKKGLLFLIF